MQIRALQTFRFVKYLFDRCVGNAVLAVFLFLKSTEISELGLTTQRI